MCDGNQNTVTSSTPHLCHHPEFDSPHYELLPRASPHIVHLVSKTCLRRASVRLASLVCVCQPSPKQTYSSLRYQICGNCPHNSVLHLSNPVDRSASKGGRRRRTMARRRTC